MARINMNFQSGVIHAMKIRKEEIQNKKGVMVETDVLYLSIVRDEENLKFVSYCYDKRADHILTKYKEGDKVMIQSTLRPDGRYLIDNVRVFN